MKQHTREDSPPDRERMFFTTSTIKNWLSLLDIPALRTIVIDSLRFMIENQRVLLHGYVVMPTHLHSIFTVKRPHALSSVFRDFHKFTSQQMLFTLRRQHLALLNRLRSTKTDRVLQVWQSSHAPLEIESHKFFVQKLEYIHYNPCQERWQLCRYPEDYPYSSAIDYLTEKSGPLPVTKPWES